MNHTTRREHGRRRVAALTMGIGAGAAVLATIFGVVFGAGTSASADTTGTGQVTTDQGSTGDNSGLQAPDQAPTLGSGGSSQTGSGGS
jgi:hypothetical protein